MHTVSTGPFPPVDLGASLLSARGCDLWMNHRKGAPDVVSGTPQRWFPVAGALRRPAQPSRDCCLIRLVSSVTWSKI